MNLPNKLTMLRVLLVPVFVIVLFLPEWFGFPAEAAAWLAAIVFIGASVTDMLDGKIARKQNLITDFGKFMDPIADKLLTCSAMIMLTHLNRLHPAATILFIGREFVISGFRLIAAKKGVVIAADNMGKAKTVLQMIFIPALLLESCRPFSWLLPYFDWLWQAVMLVTLTISVWSCVRYIVNNKGVVDFHDC